MIHPMDSATQTYQKIYFKGKIIPHWCWKYVKQR